MANCPTVKALKYWVPHGMINYKHVNFKLLVHTSVVYSLKALESLLQYVYVCT